MIWGMEDYVSTDRAAEIIKCSPRRVRQLLNFKKLVGYRLGRDWFVLKESAERYAKSKRKPGPKPKGEE
jgi:hypothetical protein